MKDYESYRNNGNKDIPDNPNLKKNEFYNRQFQDNILPGEYFDCRVNGLECSLDDKDNFAYDSGEKGAKQTELDDLQEITNAVGNTSATASTSASSASIVESAGTVITGTATVVVGASAAVVAFNAVGKDIPKLKINSIEAGSRYVHYNVEATNLDLSKDYNIIVKNAYHSFKIECSEGVNDEWVYDLKPGLQYTLTLVGPNGFGDSVEYSTTTFETISNDTTLGFNKIELIYNNDLTCGINYKATIVDDTNKFDSTYMIMKYVDGDILLDSREKEKYISNTLTYTFKDNIYSGSLSLVNEGNIQIDTFYNMGSDKDKLLSSEVIEIKYPISIKSDSENLTISGDYGLVKDLKNIRIKKENLYAKVTFYNYKNEATPIEEEINISNNNFIYTTQIPKNASYASIDIGYYDASKKYTSVRKIDRYEINAYDPEFKASYKLWGNALKLYGGYEIPEGISNVREKDIDYVATIKLYNSDQIETVINKDIEIVDNEFVLRQLLYMDTDYISFDLGYYDESEYVSVLKLDKTEIDHETDYGMDGIVGPQDEDKMNILWSWDNDQELANITLLTEFDTDNPDIYYKIELLQQGDWHWDEEYYDYVQLGEYIGNENPEFKNISVKKNGETPLTMKYTKYMRFASYEEEVEEVEIGTADFSSDNVIFDITNHWTISGNFQLSSTGVKYMSIYNEGEDEYDIDIEDADVTLYFFNSSLETTYTVPINVSIYTPDGEIERPVLTFTEELPASFTDILGYNIEYEIKYHEKYGGNIRLLKSDGIEVCGDLYYSLGMKEKQVTLLPDNKIELSYSFYSYIPSDAVLKCEIFEGVGDPIETHILEKDEVTGLYNFNVTIESTKTVNINLYDSSDHEHQSSLIGGYENYDDYNLMVDSSYVLYNEGITKDNIMWTNGENGKDILFFTGFEVVNTSDGWYTFSMDHMVNKYTYDSEVGDYVPTVVKEYKDSTDKYIMVGNLPALNDGEYYQIDSVIRSYCDKGFSNGGIEIISKKLNGEAFKPDDIMDFSQYSEGSFDGRMTGYDSTLNTTGYLFTIPADMYYAPDLMVKVIADTEEYEFKLSELYSGDPASYGGYGPQQNCVFELPGDKSGASVQLKIKLNYSLTTEKYNKLVALGLIDVIGDSLYSEYTVTFMV